STFAINPKPSEKVAALNMGGAKSNFSEQVANSPESRKASESGKNLVFEIPIYRHPKNMTQGSKPILR
ncbi:hypothetical protein N9B23_02585, partial [bacterium]|nr:hypothetical protein [bacterium]